MSDDYKNHEYQIIWKSGYIEQVIACQVLCPNNGLRLGLFGTPDPDAPNLVMFHASIDGQWVLVLSANADEIETIRNVSATKGLFDGQEE